MTPYDRLDRLGIRLPKALPTKGSYAGARAVSGQLWVSGHTARTADEPALAGIVGLDLSVDVAQQQARLAALNLLGAIDGAVGLASVTAVVHLRGYVRAASDFASHPAVIDGASTLIAEVFGVEVGTHARTAVGVASLPGGACVELEMVVATA